MSRASEWAAAHRPSNNNTPSNPSAPSAPSTPSSGKSFEKGRKEISEALNKTPSSPTGQTVTVKPSRSYSEIIKSAEGGGIITAYAKKEVAAAEATAAQPKPIQLSQQQEIVKTLGEKTGTFKTTMTPEGLVVTQGKYQAIVPEYYRQTPQGTYVSGIIEARQGATALRPQYAGAIAPSVVLASEIQKPSVQMQSQPANIFAPPTGQSFFGVSAYEKRVENINKLEAVSEYLIPSRNLQNIQDLSNWATLGGGRPPEQRSWIGRSAQTLVSMGIGFPFYTAKLGTQIPIFYAKHLATAEGLLYKDTRKNVFKEMGRSGIETGKYLISPEGLTTVAVGAFLKGYVDYKAGKFAGIKTNLKTTTYKTPTEQSLKVAVMGKRGNIESGNINVEYKGLTVKVGKQTIGVREATLFTDKYQAGLYYPKSRTAYYSSATSKNWGLSPKEVALHEAGHYMDFGGAKELFKGLPRNEYLYIQSLQKQYPRVGYNKMIEVRADLIKSFLERPSVKLFAFQRSKVPVLKSRLESSFQQLAGDTRAYMQPAQYTTSYTITAKAGEGLTFQYPRMQIPVKARGMNAPTVSITKGTIIKGSTLKIGKFKIASSEQKYDVFAQSIGRKSSGIMVGKDMDIFFQKTVKGDMLVKYLKKDAYEGKLMREFKGQLYSKAPASTQGVAFESLVKGVKNIPYSPLQMKFTSKNILTKTTRASKQFDVGKVLDKGSDNVAYPLRTAYRSRQYDILGKQKDFIGGRDIVRAFKGQAKSELTQLDVSKSGWQKSTLNGKLIGIKEIIGDIKYKIQPTYKPNTKNNLVVYLGKEPQHISVSTIRPSLATSRINVFTSESRYSAVISRYKPIKSFMTKAQNMGKKAQVSINVPKKMPPIIESIETSRLLPSLYKPSTILPINEVMASNILSSGKTGYFPIYMTPTLNIQMPESKTYTSTYTSQKTPTITKDFTKVFSFTRENTKTETPTITITPVKSMTRTSTQTVTQVLTPTITPTPIPTPMPTYTPIPKIPIPTTPKIPVWFPIPFVQSQRISYKKKKKRIRKSQYLPSYIAIAERLFGRQPRRLTGLEVRPIELKAVRW